MCALKIQMSKQSEGEDFEKKTVFLIIKKLHVWRYLSHLHSFWTVGSISKTSSWAQSHSRNSIVIFKKKLWIKQRLAICAKRENFFYKRSLFWKFLIWKDSAGAESTVILVRHWLSFILILFRKTNFKIFWDICGAERRQMTAAHRAFARFALLAVRPRK